MPISEKLLKEFRERRQEALAAGGEKKLKARHEKGIMGARERLQALFQEGTFQESGLLATHDCYDFGMAGKAMPALTGPPSTFHTAREASFSGPGPGMVRISSKPSPSTSADPTAAP